MRQSEIVGAALELLEQHGPDGLTMRAIAERLGIRAPSLYKHFENKDALEVALVAEGLRGAAATFTRVVEASDEPLHDLAHAYREWAVRTPHLYRLMTHKPLPREQLPPGLEAAAGAPLVHAIGGDVDLARAAWAFVHGMASLEIAGRFPPGADLDAAWRAGTSALNDHAHRTASQEDLS